IGEEARVLPMCHSRHYDALEVGEDRLHGLAGFRRYRGEGACDGPGRSAGANWTFSKGAVIVRAPFGDFAAPAGKFIPVHVSVHHRSAATPVILTARSGRHDRLGLQVSLAW